MNKSTAYPKGFILITSIVLMFVCSSIIFAYFMKISHEYQRVEINIAKAKAKYNALSGYALEGYENMFLLDFITDTLANGQPADSVQYYVGGGAGDPVIIEGMGAYDSISVRIRIDNNGQDVRYGHALGRSNYSTIFGKTITFTDSVDITTGPLPTLNEFMYLTGDELAGGAPQTMYGGDRGTVSFREADKFDGTNGKFQSNGQLVIHSSCPEFLSTVTVTRNPDGTYNYPELSGCNPASVFLGDPPLDTAGTVCLPPPSFDQKKQFADYTFDATELLVSDGNSYPGGLQRDELIMTELEFLPEGGFRASRYKYLMPPHLKRSLTPSTTPSSPTGDDLETSGLGFGACNDDDNLTDCSQYEQALNRYHAKTNAASTDDEYVEEYIDSDVREAHGTHHFDTHLFQFDPGRNSEFEPAGISINSTAITTQTYFPLEPVSIYVRGGPVLVHGTYKGRYTIITDEIQTYRRHAYPVNNASETPTDTIYCNIWLVGDLINADATFDGDQWSLADVQPNEDCEEGSENLMGLASGANVIIANTRVNGATGGSASGTELNINIHAHMIAFNESFTIQYWQNSISSWITGQNQDGYWNDWNVNSNSWGATPTYLADGNGNRYGNLLTGADDDRGNLYLWGGFVQLYRGYMFRNANGPYNISPGIGMDKHYYWDDNQRCNALPLYPPNLECDSQTQDQLYYEIGQFRIF